MKCSRKNVSIVLDRMIEAKANHLFTTDHVVYGRWTRVLKHWWLRGLVESTGTSILKEDFKSWLEWNEDIDGTFFDQEGVSLLVYAVCADNFSVVRDLIDNIHVKEKSRCIESRISEKGFLYFGIQGSCTWCFSRSLEHALRYEYYSSTNSNIRKKKHENHSNNNTQTTTLKHTGRLDECQGSRFQRVLVLSLDSARKRQGNIRSRSWWCELPVLQRKLHLPSRSEIHVQSGILAHSR